MVKSIHWFLNVEQLAFLGKLCMDHDVLKLDYTSSWELIAHIFFQLHVQGPYVGNLPIGYGGRFTPWKSIQRGFPPPTGKPVYQHNATIMLFIHCWIRFAGALFICPWGKVVFFFFCSIFWYYLVHGVARSRTRLSDFTFTFHFHALEKEMATHSMFLPGESQGWGSLVGCRLWGRTE